MTREALGPRTTLSYTERDDTILRAVGIIVLIVTVVVFASWPRGEGDNASKPADPDASRGDQVVPAAQHPGSDPRRGNNNQYSPMY